MGRLNEELGEEVVRLRAELAAQERVIRAREEEFGRYIAQLREGIRRERAHAADVSGSYVAAVRALTNAVEARDAYTGKHAERVAAYALELAGSSPLPGGRPGAEFGFLLHDVGKVAVPDAILHKPSALTPSERDMMRQHPSPDARSCRTSTSSSGTATEVVRLTTSAGTAGLPGPAGGRRHPPRRADLRGGRHFDAITTDRPYRTAAPIADARLEIARSAGTQFDPEAAEAFMDISLDLLTRIRDESDLTSVVAP